MGLSELVSQIAQRYIANKKKSEIKKQIADHNHDKYIATSEFNMFTAEIFNLILKRSSLAIKSDIGNFVNKTDFDSKLKYVTSSKNKLNEL